MKPFLHLLCCFLFSLLHVQSNAQCGPGKNAVTLNWDYLDFFKYSGTYATGYLANLTQAQTQHFAFGTQRVTITNNYAAGNILGDTTAHTGEAGSYATGADIQFVGNGTVTITFENEVENLTFSVYDIDVNQRMQVGARNTAGTALPVNLALPAATILTLTGSNTATAWAQASATGVSNTSSGGTVNVQVAGPVKTVTLTATTSGTASGDNGSYFISDLSACSEGSFPLNYYAVSKPYTGQPGYMLHSFDKSVYAVNPANGVTKLLFTDAAGPGNINSMAYDPYRRILYYVYSLTSTGNSRILKKYDFDTRTISTVLADINSIGIPTSTSGAESGAAAFYNGSLYLGIETSNTSRNSGREAVIWRIDFNATNVPYRASQLFAVSIDFPRLLHDWSDFCINDGILYDFDGAQTNGTNGAADIFDNDIYQYDMLTGNTVNFRNPAGFTPGQPAVDWQGRVYNIHASSVAGFPIVNPYIALYNNDGTINTAQRFNLTAAPMFTPTIPSLGDAAEAFRPKADFGDAPDSYDPDPDAPALHEASANLRLGAIMDDEWNKTASADAGADGSDEDGLAAVQIFSSAIGSYQTQVRVFNNTGAPATVCAWLDFNENGVFDPTEGVSALVPSNAVTQTVDLYWTGVSSTMARYTYTYLRVRVTSANQQMTPANATGYYPNGEVEDYYVLVNQRTLGFNDLNFTARKNTSDGVALQWQAKGETEGTVYELQRKEADGSWRTISRKTALQAMAAATYTHTDVQPVAPVSSYRVKAVGTDGTIFFSPVQEVRFVQNAAVRLYPNPASGTAYLQLSSPQQEPAQVLITDAGGRRVYSRPVSLEAGPNQLQLPLRQLSAGMYTVQVVVEGQHRAVTRLVVKDGR